MTDIEIASGLPTDRKQLIDDITTLIINAVNLHHMRREDIGPDTPFAAGGLNLDSVDILEVVVSIEQRYKVKVPDAETGKKYFGSIGNVADFVLQHRA